MSNFFNKLDFFTFLNEDKKQLIIDMTNAKSYNFASGDYPLVIENLVYTHLLVHDIIYWLCTFIYICLFFYTICTINKNTFKYVKSFNMLLLKVSLIIGLIFLSMTVLYSKNFILYNTSEWILRKLS